MGGCHHQSQSRALGSQTPLGCSLLSGPAATCPVLRHPELYRLFPGLSTCLHQSASEWGTLLDSVFLASGTAFGL